LQAFLGRTRVARSEQDAQWMLGLMRSRGSIDYGRTVSRTFAGAALYEFGQAFGDLPESEEKKFLTDIVRYMISRDL
jgi:geranylgeranyl diphosphate synthase type II